METINEEKFIYDLVVAGAGLSGMNAAISASRNGLKVALICAPAVLGGNASIDISIDINGAGYNSLYSSSGYPRETGIIEEIKQSIFHRAGYESYKSASYNGVLFDSIYNEKNIDLYLNTYANEVVMENDSLIKGVRAFQTTTEKKFYFEAPFFVDSTGDGTIGFLAGAKYMHGSEGYDEFKEGLAPEKHTDYVNGSTLMFQTINTGKEEKFIKPDFAYEPTTKPELFQNLNTNGRIFYKSRRVGGYQGFWWVEFGNDMDTIKDSEDITFELRKIVYGIWNYIKNSGKFPETWDAKLLHVGSVVGKRESRRFIGDTIVCQNDILSKKEYPDNCYIGGWPMDIHANKGIYDLDVPTHWNYVPGMYNLPLSTLYSANINNMFMCGRNTSCTRVANGSTRVMATCAVGGQAVGVAASLCKKYSCMPREIKNNYMEEMRKILLRQDQTLVGYKEEYDLKEVNVESSSVKTLENSRKDFSRLHDKDLYIAIPLTTDELESFDLGIENNTNKDTVLNYEILWGNRKENYIPESFVKKLSVTIKSNFDGFVKLNVNEKKGKDDKIYIRLIHNEDLSIKMTHEYLTGVLSFTVWQKEPDERDSRIYVPTRLRENICFKNVCPRQDIYNPNNVLSGYNRPYGLPNLWISNSKENEFLKISFKEKKVSEIDLVFDTDLAEDIIEMQAPMVIRDYKLKISGSNFEKEYNISGNYKRINKFVINENINKIEFIPLENYGACAFNLFGVKVY